MQKFIVLLLLFLSFHSKADNIHLANVHIKLMPDRSAYITEYYEFTPEYDINHGIYRFIPVRYFDSPNASYATPIDILSVKVNGQESKYHIKSQLSIENPRSPSTSRAMLYKIIYVGSSDIELTKGKRYSTEIQYTIKNIIKDQGDEEIFGWNVMGDNWKLNRERVAVTLEFPKVLEHKNIELFYSQNGSELLDSSVYVLSEDGLTLSFSVDLKWHNADYTVYARFPADTFNRSAFAWYENNWNIIYLISGLIVSLLIWLILWFKYGRDPKGQHTFMVYYASPDDLKPSEVRFFRYEQVDKTSSIAFLVQCAIKRIIEFDPPENETYLIKKGPKYSKADKRTKQLLGILMGKSDSVVIKSSKSIAARFNKLEGKLKSEIEKHHPDQFKRNTPYFLIGLIPIALTLVFSALTSYYESHIVGISHFLFPIAIWLLTYKCIRDYSERQATAKTHLALIGLIVSVFVLIVILPGSAFFSVYYGITLAAVAATAGIWKYLIENKAERTAILQDKIGGYEHYLTSTEERYLDFVNDPDGAPALFETHLPFALALGLESRWGDAFQKAIADVETLSYEPSWAHNVSLFWLTHHLHSYISSSSSAPVDTGSSGGFSGGGFSGGGFSGGGGGFGGGGGGGW